MLRAATPLSVLYLIAFTLLLVSTLTVPVIKSIPLASFKGFDYGVFGYCEGDECSALGVGYDERSPFASSDDDGDFSLPASTRNSITPALIVHPIAAVFTLICFGMAVAAHFHAQARSPRFLLILLILALPTFLLSLLAFLVDVLLFIPQLQWGGWIVLASTILIGISGIFTCVLRRTLVSREDRKRRVAENADMNGETYYANRAADGFGKVESPPPMSPMGAGFISPNKETMSEDRVPLNPIVPSPTTHTAAATPFGEQDQIRPHSPGRGPKPAVNPYGDPMPPLGQMSNRPPGPDGPYAGSNRAGGPMPFPGRGRGGYPPNRGGGFAPRGGFALRGGGPPLRGGFPPRGGYGRGGMPPNMRRPPPLQGWSSGPRGIGGGPGGTMAVGTGMAIGRGQRGPPPMGGYGNGYDHTNNPRRIEIPPSETTSYDGYGGRGQNIEPVDPHDSIGQALPMDAMHGSPARSPISPPAGNGYVPSGAGTRQDRGRNQADGDHILSPTSVYSASEEQFVPARNAWNSNATREPVPAIPGQYSKNKPNLSRTPASAQDPSPELDVNAPNTVGDGEGYYEDADPRFVHPPPTIIPSTLVPSNQQKQQPSLQDQGLRVPNAHHPQQYLQRDPSYENMAADGLGPSPAASETSHFTSVSQRAVNPYWGQQQPPQQQNYGNGYAYGYGSNPDEGSSRGGGGGGGGGYYNQQQQPPPMPMASGAPYYHGTSPPRAKQQRQQDMLLQDNPDFAVRGLGGPGGGGGGPGGRGGRGGGRGGRFPFA